MGQIELQERFIKALEERVTKRSVLVADISDILKIERDSANRRLTGKVQFSIREMGILAKQLEISIDSLLYDDICSCSELLNIESPGIEISPVGRIIEDLFRYAEKLERVSANPYSEYGAVISSLPMEVYVHYPNLLKLHCFKWAHYMWNMNDNFEQFRVDADIFELSDRVKSSFSRMDYTFCIWDYSVVWGVVSDVHYFHHVELITPQDIALIRTELEDMLNTLEKSMMQEAPGSSIQSKRVEHYVSNVDMEVSTSYLWSEEDFHSCIFTFFMRSAASQNKKKCMKMREWANSMKRVSTLISGSGELARVKFFKKQRQYLESL